MTAETCVDSAHAIYKSISIYITWQTNPEALQATLIETQMGKNNLENPCSTNKNPIFDITDAILKLYWIYFIPIRCQGIDKNPKKAFLFFKFYSTQIKCRIPDRK